MLPFLLDAVQIFYGLWSTYFWLDIHF
jgi:hypothetical protein